MGDILVGVRAAGCVEFRLRQVQVQMPLLGKGTAGCFACKLGNPRRLNSQGTLLVDGCHSGLLARGDAGIFMRFPHAGYREKIWDHCAGAVIVREAGGTLSDASGAPQTH